jgi:hypothetical protein
MKIFQFVTNDDIDILAKTMLMIETGIEKWVDGKEVDNPNDYTVYDTGFCKISTYAKTTNIFLILPEGDIINHITEFIRKLEEKFCVLNLTHHNIQRTETTFSIENVDVVCCSSSIISSSEKFIKERVFIYNKNESFNNVNNCMFKWEILYYIKKPNMYPKNILDWFINETSIIIDCTGITHANPGTLLSSTHDNDYSMLIECNILPFNMVKLILNNNNKYIPITNFTIDILNSKDNSCKNNKITFTDDTKSNTNYIFTKCDFNSLNFEGKDKDIDIKCQCCKTLLYGPFTFAFLLPKTKNVFGFCNTCFTHIYIIKALSIQLKPIMIKLSRTFKDICEKQYKYEFTFISTLCKIADSLNGRTISSCNNCMVIDCTYFNVKYVQDIVKFQALHKNAVIASIYNF